MEKVELEYEYITETQDSTRDIDMGIEMIKRGEQKLQFTYEHLLNAGYQKHA